MQRDFQQLKATAKKAALTSGRPYSEVRRFYIRETHFALSAIGTPRRENGNKLGLRRRYAIAEPELVKRFDTA